MSSVQTIEVHTAPAYEVTIGAGLRRDCGARLKAVLGGCRIAVAADSNVAPLYLETVCASLRDAGFATAALALADDALSIADTRLKATDKLALVLGTEGDGLAASTIAACDWTVRIPMHHGVDSLNVAAASAVAFWETRREG